MMFQKLFVLFFVQSPHLKRLFVLLNASIDKVALTFLLSNVPFPDYMLRDWYEMQSMTIELIMKLCFTHQTWVKLILSQQVLIFVPHRAEKLVIKLKIFETLHEL